MGQALNQLEWEASEGCLRFLGHEEGVGQVSSAAGSPVPRPGQARSLHINHRLGQASDSPRLPLPPFLEKAAECHWNLFA